MGGRKARRASDAHAPAPPTAESSAAHAGASGPNRGRKRKGGRGNGRSIFSRLVYWAFVLGLWISIAAVGALVFAASTLPPIQSLEVPKRPPSIEIVGIDGRPLVTRGEMSGTDVPIKQLPPYLPKA